MQTLWLVIKELWYFVWFERFGFRSPPAPALILPAAPALVPEQTPVARELPLAPTSSQTTQGQVKPSPEPLSFSVKTKITSDTSVVYAGLPEVALHMYPTATLDGVLSHVTYGTQLVYHKRQGKWLCVSYGDLTGWVNDESMVVDSSMVEPQLHAGEIYSDTDNETIKLRTIIKDEFGAVAAELPLQNIEYIQYRLLRAGHQVPWGADRPRIAGVWQRLLKGLPGVHIGIHPKTDSVMEYIDEEEIGHLAYVEAVYPDRSLALTEVAADGLGQFNSGTYHEEVWKGWQPVFIALS